MCYTIPATKANRLYWLGRYAERVYESLHLLRKCYDEMIDGHPEAFEGYFKKLDSSIDYRANEAFRLEQMYDNQNPSSLMRSIEAANDNAIVLREEIKSESLAYIQMSLVHIKKCADAKEGNITALQPITDHLLAFFGSIDERVYDDRIRNIIRIGKSVELLDMLIRFDYPYKRVDEAYETVKKCTEGEFGLVNIVTMHELEELIDRDKYEHPSDDYKQRMLTYLNKMILV